MLRGDGRTYIANIQTDSTQQEDLYQAFVYTRGGPEWQTVQIPFSDFLLTSLGYVQNEQAMLNRSAIRTVGVLLADRTDGDFKLSIREIRSVRMVKEVSNMDV